MGFSLKYFFSELESIIEAYNREDLDQFDFIEMIVNAVATNKEYAKECNLID
jgi:hypothetical protein